MKNSYSLDEINFHDFCETYYIPLIKRLDPPIGTKYCGINTCINPAIEGGLYCTHHQADYLRLDRQRIQRFGELKVCKFSRCNSQFRSKDSDFCPDHR